MILLDTNSLIWVLSGSPSLGDDAKQRLVTSTRPHFSAVSVLEMAIKRAIGKLQVPPDPRGSALSAGLHDLPFTSQHAAGVDGFPELARHDPFDRMLLAQAEVEGMHLLTSDRVLLGLGLDWVIDSRA